MVTVVLLAQLLLLGLDNIMETKHAMLRDNIVINIVMYEYDETLEKYYTFISLPNDSTVSINDAYNPQTGLFEHRDAIVPETTVVVFE
jgi:hypothetical protein